MRKRIAVLIILIAVVACSTIWLTAQQPPRGVGNQIAIDPDDIAGVVTSSRGPEAGVWVIAETSDTPTRLRKIVVTDDQGRGWTFDFTMTDTLALAGAGDRQYGAVPPGLPTEAVVVFDVPPDATGLTLGVAEDLGATSEPRPDPFAIRLEG